MLAYFVLYSPNHEAPPFSFGNYSVCGIPQAADPWDRISWGAGVPTRRLDDRIRELCQQAIAARSADELDTILAELRSALDEHSKRVRKRFLTLVLREKG